MFWPILLFSLFGTLWTNGALFPRRIKFITSAPRRISRRIRLIKLYWDLCNLECLSAREEEVLDSVLSEAQKDEHLDYLITKADSIIYIISQKQNLMSEEELQDQNAFLKEFFVAKSSAPENANDSVTSSKDSITRL